MISTGTRHSENQQRDMRPCENTRSEKQVKKTMEAFQSFISPFKLETNQPLTSLSLGAAMPEEVCHDVLNALKKDQSQKEEFISERHI